MSHDYVSTACLHEAEDPALHSSCRKTCKFCNAGCQCPGHNQHGKPAYTVTWVDQARDVARELLPRAALPLPPGLAGRIAGDPALFWLRGEERPPGTWQEGATAWTAQSGDTQGAPGPGELLTRQELYASEQAGLLFGYIAENIIAHGPTREADLAELVTAIHHVQRMIYAQAAARAYPGRIRLLGSVVPLREHRPPPSLPG